MGKGSNDAKATKAKDSEAFKKAKNKAEEYASNPEKLSELIDKASKKANGKRGPLDAVWLQLTACFRLIKAYASGSYREIPWSSLIMLVAAVIYFVMPVDLIPDFILGLGLLDDAALLGWTVKTFSSDIDAFVEWEERVVA
jgi:uncharacterized membrane protein YkvA (DUF1232 family)